MQRKSIIAILIIIAGFVVLGIGIAYDLNTANKALGQTVDNQTDRDNLTEAQRQEEVQKTGKESCESLNKLLELENLTDQMFEC